MDDSAHETVVDLRQTGVGIDIDALGTHDSIVTAVANLYEAGGHQTQQLWVGDLGDGSSTMFDLVVEDLKLLVDVETLDTLLSLDPNKYRPWRDAGYRIMLVAPREKVAQVRRREGSAVDEIVPWTTDGPKVILGDLIDA